VRDDEPQPPRQLDRDIPPELERACLKALAKRFRGRYTTAADFAEDLRLVSRSAGPASPASSRQSFSGILTRGPQGEPSASSQRDAHASSSSRRRAREAERRRLCQALHQALNPGGFLMIGAAESIYGVTDAFSTESVGGTIVHGRR
jgi:hypothetical protein